MDTEFENNNVTRLGFYSSIFLTVITLITFGFAMTAIPISGAFCPGDCLKYPYLDTLSHFPKDYIWMFFAFFLILAYLIFIVSIDLYASRQRKIFSRISLIFAIISTVVLLLTYFVQFSVIPASLINNETEGITILTQYNPHGLFIALEELGYILMGFSFLFIAFVFINKSPLETTISWIYIITFILIVLSFIVVTVKYGVVRQDRFEVIVLSIDWLVLIANGILTSLVFKRAMKS